MKALSAISLFLFISLAAQAQIALPGGVNSIGNNPNKIVIGTNNPYWKSGIELSSNMILLSNSTGNVHSWFPFEDGNVYISGDAENGSGEIIFRKGSAFGQYTNYMRIKNNGNVGIGTTNPNAKLHVNGSFNFLTGAERLHWGSKHVGTSDHRSYLAPRKTDDSGWDWDQEFGYHNHNRAWYFDGNVGIGTASPSHKLAVNGTIRAKEIIVDTGWSDFVFEKDYHLRSLEEVENYIIKHGHLPDIPSAKEVEENGVKVGEMESRLLQKIEELTLYVIELKKEIGSLKDGE